MSNEAKVPILPDKDDLTDKEREQSISREFVREQGSKLVELARRHAFSEFDSDRADDRIYEDEDILDLFSIACLTQGRASADKYWEAVDGEPYRPY